MYVCIEDIVCPFSVTMATHARTTCHSFIHISNNLYVCTHTNPRMNERTHRPSGATAILVTGDCSVSCRLYTSEPRSASTT